ncbi:MAG: hypothetical protein WCF85_06435 [Rhodospirillaceae bacterium]
MVETRPTGRTGLEGVRPELPGSRTVPGTAPGRTNAAAPGVRGRIPTLRQLAALVVNGMLTLPRNYRRGMFLDILV